MAMLAMAVPILPGKTDQWRGFVEELRSNRYNDYVESRKRLGVRERAFLQETPHGDMVILALDGDDPARAFQSFGTAHDPFTDWFVQQVQEIHGFDLRQPPPGPLPMQVIDSQTR